ncbi:DUF4920 domain-containing protein [Galbibacter sp. BG1]|uniref:DUF4920 domain-containing protein n=1 Tax=Galbibacter sp. BG1 TaxID=1170699 RepID=UPI0015BD52E7|nr:DUF4920 domain-containing protein [Galbibacter sp. BG1]QLE02145.1 DUF4920 domain-containing protein [Galbibacter sp. BG1]
MKIKILFVFVVALMLSCNSEKSNNSAEIAANYYVYGDTISIDEVLPADEIQKKYESMKLEDTLSVVFKAKVNDVCQAKGCWMKLDLENGEEAMVKFKEYSFFVPKDIANKQVVLGGKAFVVEMDVEEQKHYAEDAGKTNAEIAAITTPLKTYSFEANGVLLPK